MPDFVFNISKGRVVELYNRVRSNDPANSGLVVVPVSVGAITDATLRDLDTLDAIITAGVVERTTGGWTRKTLTDTELSTFTFPPTTLDTTDQFDLDIPDLTWTGVSLGTVSDLIICYDNDTTLGTNVNLIPLTQHDFVITPDGSDVVAQIGASGFFRAQ